MKWNQRNFFVRFILRTLDVFVCLYLRRPVRWNKEPFQKATLAEKRYGAVFMAMFPAAMTAVILGGHSLNTWIDLMISGRHSIVWFYAIVISLFVCGGVILIFLGPKVPLFISIPAALAAWLVCLWAIFLR